jgi:hypothetical protein
MEIYHHVSINVHADDPFYLETKRLQIEHKNAPLPGNPLGLVTFSIAESDPRWPIIQQQIALYGAADIIGTKFSLEEIENLEWSRFVVLYEWGYPQPEKHHKWVEQTYQNYCPQCGAGYTQIKPFLLKLTASHHVIQSMKMPSNVDWIFLKLLVENERFLNDAHRRYR